MNDLRCIVDSDPDVWEHSRRVNCTQFGFKVTVSVVKTEKGPWNGGLVIKKTNIVGVPLSEEHLLSMYAYCAFLKECKRIVTFLIDSDNADVTVREAKQFVKSM